MRAPNRSPSESRTLIKTETSDRNASVHHEAQGCIITRAFMQSQSLKSGKEPTNAGFCIHGHSLPPIGMCGEWNENVLLHYLQYIQHLLSSTRLVSGTSNLCMSMALQKCTRMFGIPRQTQVDYTNSSKNVAASVIHPSRDSVAAKPGCKS